jgi:hypothetical protein
MRHQSTPNRNKTAASLPFPYFLVIARMARQLQLTLAWFPDLPLMIL